MERLLSKSRFVTALECPTKLSYLGKKDQYPDIRLDDEFLMALVEGGFQVGALARAYYPGGVLIEELNPAIAIKQTDDLLTQDDAIIYEPAFKYGNCFIRADILIKKGKILKLIEAKAKSYHPDESFLTKKGVVRENWKPYLYDVAFQKFVIRKSLQN